MIQVVNTLKRLFRTEMSVGLIVLLTLTVVLSTLGLTVALKNSMSPSVYSSSDWSSWASTGWRYYQPGVGVNSNTGLHKANLGWGCFADWDLGSYIYATIFARRLGLINDNGTWQFDDRINRILSFLQNRTLDPDNTPYKAYTWDSLPGTPCPDWGPIPTDLADSGRLLAALYALKNFRSSYTATVNSIVQRTKSAYDSFATRLVTDYYNYLYAEGFSAFGYSESRTLKSIDNYSGGFTSIYGQSLPSIGTVTEPIIHVLLEAHMLVHPPSSNFIDFAHRVMLTQQGRSSALGKLTAWSEGGYPPGVPAGCPGYMYEVILDTNGAQWVMKLGNTIYTGTCPPLAYTKVAFAYLALYGESTYTLSLVDAAKNLASSSYGFGEATLETGESAIGLWKDELAFYSDKTNEFILAAAYHAHISSPTATASTIIPLTSSSSTAVTEFSCMLLTAILTAFSVPFLVLIIHRLSKTKKEQT